MKDRATCKEVSLFEYLGGFENALRQKVFCSPCWQDACCTEVDTPDGRKVRVDLDAYPPGGKNRTAMRRCGICGRWAPRDGVGNICADCRTVQEAEAFFKRLRCIYSETEDKEFVRILVRLYWVRPPVLSRLKKSKAGVDVDAFLPDHLAEQLDASLSEMNTTASFEQQVTGGRHWLAEALDMPERRTARRTPGAAVRSLEKHLRWAVKDSPRRAIGCSVVLLPEDEKAMRKEIAEYEATGRLQRVTMRQDRVNPHRRSRGTFSHDPTQEH